MGIFSPE